MRVKTNKLNFSQKRKRGGRKLLVEFRNVNKFSLLVLDWNRERGEQVLEQFKNLLVLNESSPRKNSEKNVSKLQMRKEGNHFKSGEQSVFSKERNLVEGR